jgi:hypothetical protein
MNLFKRIVLVLAAAIASGLPGAIAIQSQTTAPIWYKALASFIGAIGVGLIGIALGALVLIAARNKPNGGVKAAIVVAVVAGLFASWSVFYGMQRSIQ